jgi:uncharacterized membrane protein YphA (DoxX/SURF4 family)
MQQGPDNLRVFPMQRLFSAFPGGRAGIALLLLRAALGIALMFQGGFYLREPGAPPTTWLEGIAALVAGALLLLGYFTPIVGIAVVLGGLGIYLELLPPGAPALFDTKLAIVFAMTILLALILIGPGAFSVDARVFGRREIIIPSAFRTPE